MLFYSVSNISNSDLSTAVFDKRTARELAMFNISFDAIKHVLLNLGKAVGHNMLSHTSSTVY
jgi:hypothetical protein